MHILFPPFSSCSNISLLNYSFFNKNAQACVEDYNDILIEDDIMKAVSVNEDISGITAVIIDAVNLFGKKSLEKINFKIKLEHSKHMKYVVRKIQ